MALKGTTKIELTNVKTGRKEVYRHDNMVTNVISEILSLNPFGMRFRNTSGNDFATNCLPVVPNLIGGILLYENALEEDPAQYYASIDNPLIGYSSNDVNEGADAKRGSLNQTESGKLDDGSGYRFVFDFATSQANGEISALGLTSKWGGIGGHGSMQETARNSVLLMQAPEVFSVGAGSSKTELRRILNSVVAIDGNSNIAYSARQYGNNTVMIAKFRIPFTEAGLFDSFKYDVEYRDTEIQYLTTKNFGAVYATSNYNYATFIDGGDYIWGFQHSGNADGNSSGNATVLWIKISKADFSFEEGEWTLSAQLYRFGKYNTVDKSTSGYYLNYAIIKDGFLYALKYDLKGVYVISLDNPTDITLLESSFAVDATPYYGSTGSSTAPKFTGTAVNEVAGVITYKNAYISCGVIHRRASIAYSSNDACLLLSARPGIRYGPYMLGLALYDHTWSSYDHCYQSARFYLPTAYLATINNLPAPVQKTADKTMKITYILREE